MKPDHDRADFEEEPFYEADIPTLHIIIVGGVLLFLVSCTIGFFVLLTRG